MASLKIKEYPFLKKKKILLAAWGCMEKDNYQCRDWIPALRNLFGKNNLFIMSTRNEYFRFGKDAVNRKLLDLIIREKPEYLLFGLNYDEIYLRTLEEIRKLSPKTKILNMFGDDDWRYDDFSRYYAPFLDVSLNYKADNSPYLEDGLTNQHFIWGAGINFFKPLGINKKYDVTFIGMPLADRYDYIKYLMDNGIKIALFGMGWENYQDLKFIYKGFLDSNDFVKVINQSKINLNLSKTFFKEGKKGQLKGRLVEMPACKAFVLTEYSDRNIGFFKKNKNVNFKTKEELLDRIKYFLKNEKEREELAEKAYTEVTKTCSWEYQFGELFKKIENNQSYCHQIMPYSKDVANLSYKDLNSKKEALKKLNGKKYIAFSINGVSTQEYKERLQRYSLEKSGKPISYTDYYVHNNWLGNYLTFKSKQAFNELSHEDLKNFLNLGQIMVSKPYFLRNFNIFKNWMHHNKISKEFTKKENAVFVSVPLVITDKKLLKLKSYESVNKAYYMRFREQAYSLLYQKKFFSSYLIKLILSSIKENIIREYFLSVMKSKQLRSRMKA